MQVVEDEDPAGPQPPRDVGQQSGLPPVVRDEVEHVDQGGGIEEGGGGNVGSVAELKSHTVTHASLGDASFGQLEHVIGRIDPVHAQVGPRPLEVDDFDAGSRTHHQKPGPAPEDRAR